MSNKLRPKNYLSWSALNTLENSEEQYRRFYIRGEKMPINQGMAFGKQVADALEKNETTGDIVTDLILSQLPRCEFRELKIEAKIPIGGEVIPLLSFIDTANGIMSAFKEYKTGTTAWDQKKADNHGQITFYCVVMQALTGKIPDDIELIWAPTRKNSSGEMELTGEIRRFKTKRTTADILKMKIRIKKAWKRIAEMVEEELL